MKPERGIGLARGDESVELIGAVEVEHGLSAQDQRRRHSEVLAGRLDVAGFGSFAVPSFLWAFTGHRVTQFNRATLKHICGLSAKSTNMFLHLVVAGGLENWVSLQNCAGAPWHQRPGSAA